MRYLLMIFIITSIKATDHTIETPDKCTQIYITTHYSNANTNHLLLDQLTKQEVNQSANHAANQQANPSMTHTYTTSITVTPSTPFYKNALNQAMSLRDFAVHYTQQNAKKILFFGLTSAYTFIVGYLVYANYCISSPDRWIHWKGSLPLNALQALPQKEIAEQLLRAVQYRYQTKEKLNDFLTPLLQFLKDIERELTWLERMSKIHRTVNILKLSWFFPQQSESLNKIPEYIERLSYLKELLLEWIASKKVELNLRTAA